MRAISLFSGAMGLDLGLEQSGIEVVACAENDQDAVGTIKRNRPDLTVLDTSIAALSGRDVLDAAGLRARDVDVLVGGPPCQAFSVFGRRKGLADPRGRLVFDFARMAADIRPPQFLMENVRGLLSMPLVSGDARGVSASSKEKGSLMAALLAEMQGLGYDIDVFVVNAVNYGAPQLRERVLVFGNRHGRRIEFPTPTHSNRPVDGLQPFTTLGEVIGPESGFTDPDPEILDFSERKKGYLRMIPEGSNWRALPIDIQKESMGKSWYLKGGRSAYWRRLSFDFPSPTVVTMPNHAGTSMCHPVETRAISVAEAGAIQEFPPEWQFEGTTASKFRQIGNAVPVRLGTIAGEVIRRVADGDFAKAEHDGPRIVHLRPHVRTRQFWKDGEVATGHMSYYAARHGTTWSASVNAAFDSGGSSPR